VRLLGDALDQVKLSPRQQEAIEALGSTVAKSEAGVQDAKRELIAALAKQVAAGRVDRRALVRRSRRS